MKKNSVVNGIVFDTAKVNCMWGTRNVYLNKGVTGGINRCSK